MFLREALFTSGSAKLDLSVRVSVCLCVWIIIDFCDWDMEGVTSLLLIGSLNYDFGGSRTKTEKKSSKTSISDWDTNVQGSGFEQVLDTVWGHF